MGKSLVSCFLRHSVDSRTCKTLKCCWQFVKRNWQFLHQLATILGPIQCRVLIIRKLKLLPARHYASAVCGIVSFPSVHASRAGTVLKRIALSLAQSSTVLTPCYNTALYKSMRLTFTTHAGGITGTARIVSGAGSMKRSVCLSVRPSVPSLDRSGGVRRICC